MTTIYAQKFTHTYTHTCNTLQSLNRRRIFVDCLANGLQQQPAVCARSERKIHARQRARQRRHSVARIFVRNTPPGVHTPRAHTRACSRGRCKCIFAHSTPPSDARKSLLHTLHLRNTSAAAMGVGAAADAAASAGATVTTRARVAVASADTCAALSDDRLATLIHQPKLGVKLVKLVTQPWPHVFGCAPP